MEEKVIGGKDKKYVLYTVVGEDKGRAGVGVWLMRGLLASLLLVALAVVPYVSLKLAQVNDHTLVVFQPFPVHNHTNGHHRQLRQRHLNDHLVTHNDTSTHVPTIHSNVTSTKSPVSTSVSPNMTDNVTNGPTPTLDYSEAFNTTEETSRPSLSEKTTKNSNTLSSTPATIQVQDVNVTSAAPPSTAQTINASTSTTTNATQTSKLLPTVSSKEKEVHTLTKTSNISPDKSMMKDSKTTSIPQSTEVLETTTPKTPPETFTSQVAQTTRSNVMLKDVTTEGQTLTLNSSKVIEKLHSTFLPTSTFEKNSTFHLPKLAYIATAAHGNHVGGFAAWRNGNKVTDWSYFYENIPMEYQGYQNYADHEMRGMLVAIRTWASKCHDYHVVLRSHHSAIYSKTQPTKLQLKKEVEALSENHFTYEFEWRSRRSDKLVEIATNLARLHRDFKHWYGVFKSNVDSLIGEQNWTIEKKQHRAIIQQSTFDTDEVEEEMPEAQISKEDQSLLDMLKPSSLVQY